VKRRPATALRRFEVLILRPLNLVFLAAAVVCLLKAAWVLAVAMFVCCFFVGVIGQSLPHRKQETISELASGGTLPAHDEGLSHEDAFVLAKTIQRTALLVGFAASLIAWKTGLRWYWILLVAFSTYFVVGLLAAILGATNPPARRANETPIGLPDWTEEEKKILFGDYKRKGPPEEDADEEVSDEG